MTRSTALAKPAAQRQRQPTEIRRLLIVDAAREIISERGLFATTMRDIAGAADVSLGTLTYHFTGIAEILNEVLDREMALFYEPLVGRARDIDDGIDALCALIDGFFGRDPRTVQHWRLWLDFWSVSAHDEHYARRQQLTYRQWRADVARMFARAAAQGAFASADLDVTVSDFLTLFDGSAAQAFLPLSPRGPGEARAALNRWLRAAAATPPAPRPSRRSRR